MTDQHLSPTFSQRWWLAIRPKTLPAAIAPVILGWAFAYRTGFFRAPAALAALLIALLIQIGTNLVNDVVDFSKGADTEARTGPTRVTQGGLLSPRQVWTGVFVSFGLAVLFGSYLVLIAGWPALVLGIASLLAGGAYTAGPYPLAYHGLGGLFVLLFFGLVAVGGTVLVTADMIPPDTWLGALAAGVLTVNILVVNNIRDINTDRAAGRTNLAVKFGRKAAEWQYALNLVIAYAVPILLVCIHQAAYWSLLPLISLPLGINIWQILRSGQVGSTLNPQLGRTARLLLIFCLLLAIGLII
ncbi:MAG: 1,4-dihydroxy-2-naphthoate polyprenyltransferase [Anaerolineales bacterium]|nr:1,4-dihydroxy-2-naphthoate polyprenyltransferase [Anaerolineales bacterium]